MSISYLRRTVEAVRALEAMPTPSGKNKDRKQRRAQSRLDQARRLSAEALAWSRSEQRPQIAEILNARQGWNSILLHIGCRLRDPAVDRDPLLAGYMALEAARDVVEGTITELDRML
jgi:hypothetical protein